jgi:hypothetical protein
MQLLWTGRKLNTEFGDKNIFESGYFEKWEVKDKS